MAHGLQNSINSQVDRLRTGLGIISKDGDWSSRFTHRSRGEDSSPRGPRFFGLDVQNRVLQLGFLTAILVFGVGNVGAATHWVGSSPQCTGANVHSTLGAALFAAAFSSADDEIRLTDTVSYAGGVPELINWHPGVAGALTIAGGYDDCFGSRTGKTTLSSNSGAIIEVSTTSQPSSVVTLRHLELTGGPSRAVIATGGAEVALDDVWVHHNYAGALVTSGASLSLHANSSIEDNTDFVSVGGGISCSGSGTYVGISGSLKRNYATNGGNLQVGAGCTAELFGGALIQGLGAIPSSSAALFGGGIYVGPDGFLVAQGGSSQVVIRDHYATSSGGGLYISGTGAAVLFNTRFLNNLASEEGGAIVARDGGIASVQLTMDRATECPFLISCSEIDFAEVLVRNGHAIFVDNSRVMIRRTVIDEVGDSSNPWNDSIIYATNGALVQIDGLGIGRSGATRIFHATDGSVIEAGHVTTTLNSYQGTSGPAEPWTAVLESGSSFDARNSIFASTRGFSASGGSTVSGVCNLVDTGNGMPPGSFFVGVPLFNHAPSGDWRQTPASPGVDMCAENAFDFSGTDDIEKQSRPVDEATNANGSPGQAGQIYDAGFDEVHANITIPIFIDGFESGNTSQWSSSTP